MNASTQALVAGFEDLSQQLIRVDRLLRDCTLPHWLMSEQGEQISLADACPIITNIWYQAKGDGRRTQNLYGLVAVDEVLYNALEALNQSKQNFQREVKRFQHQTDTPASLLKKRAELLSQSLQHQGLARLHLKQCYRQLPLLPEHPDKVGFSWYSSGRSIKKLTVQDAEAKLLKLDTSQKHIQLQLQALANIPSAEPLAQLQTQVPVMRANILWKQQGEKQRKARNCPLPLFFLMDAKKAFPEYNAPAPRPPEQRTRMARSDLSIDPTPFLPSLRVHRYAVSK